MGRAIVTRASIEQDIRERLQRGLSQLPVASAHYGADVEDSQQEPEGEPLAKSRSADTGSSLSALAPLQEPDDYQAKLVKLIPAEIIGAYLSADGIIRSADASAPRVALLWISFVILLAFTPFYLIRFGKVPLKNRAQLLVSTGAFVVWVFALPGSPFANFGWYHPVYAPLLLLFYTFVPPKLIGLEIPDQEPR